CPSAKRVSKARDDLPEPDTPVMTTRRLRGISTWMFFRLCSRAPRTTIASIGPVILTEPGAGSIPPGKRSREGATAGGAAWRLVLRGGGRYPPRNARLGKDRLYEAISYGSDSGLPRSHPGSGGPPRGGPRGREARGRAGGLCRGPPDGVRTQDADDPARRPHDLRPAQRRDQEPRLQGRRAGDRGSAVRHRGAPEEQRASGHAATRRVQGLLPHRQPLQQGDEREAHGHGEAGGVREWGERKLAEPRPR